MSLQLQLTDRAEAQIRLVDTWWQEQRPSARFLFRDELAAACETIVLMPSIGNKYPMRNARDARRLLLRASRYHVYYREIEGAILVLAVWSAVRGRGPDLGSRR